MTTHLNNKRTGIAVFGFLRPRHLANVLKSLKYQGALDNTHVFIDGTHETLAWGKEPAKCQQIGRKFVGDRSLACNGHMGIEKLLLDAVGIMIDRYERIVVLEDDCFPTAHAIRVFEQELDRVEREPDIFSVYGHPFLVPQEGTTFTRFQGWGWATTREKMRPILQELRDRFMMPEPVYLQWVQATLTSEIRARLDVTPGRNVIETLRRFYSWDSCTALLTAQRGLLHCKTPVRVVYNCGLGGKGTHFPYMRRFEEPPFNMVAPKKVWRYFHA